MTARSWRRGLAGAPGLPLLLVLGGCQGGEPQRPPVDVGATQAVCAKDVTAVSLPAAYPRTAALPGGYLVTKVENRSEGRIVVTGVSPKDFRATLADMQRTFSANGWTLSQGEVEKDDAESNFEGNGFRGRWAIRAIEQCPGNTGVSVVVGPQGPPSTG